MSRNENKSNRKPTLEQLECENAELAAQIHTLLIRHDKVRKRLRANPSYVAPFNRLPAELLVMIAEHYMETEKSPVPLTNVCIKMRMALFEKKSLWTNIWVVCFWSMKWRERRALLSTVDGIYCTGDVDLDRLLKRAHPMPCKVTFLGRLTVADWALLAPYAQNICSLSLIGVRNEFEVIGPLYNNPKFLRLQSFSMTDFKFEENFLPYVMDMVDTSEVPYLDVRIGTIGKNRAFLQNKLFRRHMSLAFDLDGEITLPARAIQLPNVDFLSLDRNSHSLLPSISASKLSSLNIAGMGCTLNPRSIPPSITYLRLAYGLTLGTSNYLLELRNLTCLVLSDITLNYSLIESFYLPNLEELALLSVNDEPFEDSDADEVPEFEVPLFRPIPSLKRLRFDNGQGARRLYLPFDTFPSLRAFHITNSELEEYSYFSYLDNGGLPRLEELVLKGNTATSGGPLDIEAIREELLDLTPLLRVYGDDVRYEDLRHQFLCYQGHEGWMGSELAYI